MRRDARRQSIFIYPPPGEVQTRKSDTFLQIKGYNRIGAYGFQKLKRMTVLQGIRDLPLTRRGASRPLGLSQIVSCFVKSGPTVHSTPGPYLVSPW